MQNDNIPSEDLQETQKEPEKNIFSSIPLSNPGQKRNRDHLKDQQSPPKSDPFTLDNIFTLKN